MGNLLEIVSVGGQSLHFTLERILSYKFCRAIAAERYTNADTKILQCIRLHIKNNTTQIARYAFYHLILCTLDKCKIFV